MLVLCILGQVRSATANPKLLLSSFPLRLLSLLLAPQDNQDHDLLAQRL